MARVYLRPPIYPQLYEAVVLRLAHIRVPLEGADKVFGRSPRRVSDLQEFPENTMSSPRTGNS